VAGYRLDDQGSIPERGGYFSLRHRVRTGSGAHPVVRPVRSVKLTTRLPLVASLRMHGTIPMLPPPLHASESAGWAITLEQY